MDYILSLDISDAMEQISTAVKSENEEKYMFRWIVGGYERFLSYSEFKLRLNEGTDSEQVFDTRTEAEILADVKDILSRQKTETTAING